MTLDAKEALGDRLGLATVFYELGNVAQLLQRFDLADEWYLRALKDFEALEHTRGVALTTYQLGNVSVLRRDLDGAMGFYRNSLTMFETIRDWHHTAQACFALGRLDKQRGDLSSAKQWYLRSLQAHHSMGDQDWRGRATLLLELGSIAAANGEYDASHGWFTMCLTISEDHQEWQDAVRAYSWLGRLAERSRRRGRTDYQRHRNHRQ